MTAEQQDIQKFQTRVRQLILAHKQQQADNEQLLLRLDGKDEEIKSLKSQLLESQRAYNTLKTAKMFEISTTDVEGAKGHIAKLIRDIDKCISLIKE